MKAPWRSAMNQGRAMQAFLRAYRKTADTQWLECARKAMNTLFTGVSAGGVTYFDSTGYWYEEYADDSAPGSRVLNGMIVVLEALKEYDDETGSRPAGFLFRRGVDYLKESIHRYDCNGHSNYDLLGKPASKWYHEFHIRQLGFLYEATGEKVFGEYRDLWAAYKNPSYLKALAAKPSRIGIAAVVTLFIGLMLVLSLAVRTYLRFSRKRDD
jgi:hypothetical protein